MPSVNAKSGSNKQKIPKLFAVLVGDDSDVITIKNQHMTIAGNRMYGTIIVTILNVRLVSLVSFSKRMKPPGFILFNF